MLANFSAWPNSRIKKELLAIKPDVIGISQWTHNRHIALEFAQICRTLFPNSMIVMGGGHATFCYDDILAEGSPVDIVVLGEGEVTLLELIRHLQSKTAWQNTPGLAFRHNNTIVVSPPQNKLDSLDRLPIPARYLGASIGLDIELQSEFIVTTRGCPSTCYFCSSPDFWGRIVRFRSPGAIIEEILYIRNTYGLIYFSIRDDTFTADRKRVLEFCAQLQEQSINILWNCQSRVTAIDKDLLIEMKRAGCECIQLGVESGSPRILKQLGKNITPDQIVQACMLIREIGINLSIYLISDIPGETADDIRQTRDLIRSIHPNDGYVSPLAYYPGTKLYKDAVVAGIIRPNIFRDPRSAALYATPTQGKSSAGILKDLANNQQDSPKRFAQQKTLLGYCFTTNVIAGEWYRQQGAYRKAENEFLEITARQPGNPWGWFLLGDLYFEQGRSTEGKEFYAKTQTIVPHHGPSKAV